ncbi:MAG: methyltransferase domain-containing protein [Calothrix sp. MO_192.B10]|nr:methyltransferase domain-containing protein [Calothrix sp. MO_192.B10]
MTTTNHQSTTTLYSVFQEESSHFHQGYWAEDMQEDRLDIAHVRYLQELTKTLSIKTGDIVLDLGCGGGAGAIWLAKTFGCHVHAIDLVADNVLRARKSVQNANLENLIEVHQMDAVNMSFASDFFDHVIAVESIYHIQDKQSVFKEIQRVLKPNCYLAIADYLLESCSCLVRQLAAVFFESKYMTGINEHYQMFKDAGLQVVSELDVTEETIIRTFDWGKRTNYSLLRTMLREAYGPIVYHLTSFVFSLPIITLPRKLAADKTVKMEFITCVNSN